MLNISVAFEGYMRDKSGSFVSSFHSMGACGILAAIVLRVMQVLQRREERSKAVLEAATKRQA